MISLLLSSVAASAILINDTGPTEVLNVYNFTGADETYVVPAGVTVLHVGLAGGAGGPGSYSPNLTSGAGGYTYVRIPVVEGDVLLIQVGEGGEPARPFGSTRPDGANKAGRGGWPDGGDGSYGDAPGGGGGGSSRIWLNGVLIAVAGAGGGDAGFSGSGGAGGGLQGQDSTSPSGGSGGTQTAGGFDKDATSVEAKKGLQITSPIPARTGGFGGVTQDTTTSTTDDGAGGGGGYWGGGGGGGDARAAGGGSGYVNPSFTGQTFAGDLRIPPTELTNLPAYVAGIATGRFSQNNRQHGGNGLVVLSTDPAQLNKIQTGTPPEVISYGGVSVANNTNTRNVAYPPVFIGGDRIFLFVFCRASNVFTPTGFVQIADFRYIAGSNNKITVFTKITNGTEAATELVTTNSFGAMGCQMIAVRNAQVANIAVELETGQMTGAGTVVTWPSAQVYNDNTLILFAYVNSISTDMTIEAGWTQTTPVSLLNQRLLIAHRTESPPFVDPNISITRGSSTDTDSVAIAILVANL